MKLIRFEYSYEYSPIMTCDTPERLTEWHEEYIRTHTGGYRWQEDEAAFASWLIEMGYAALPGVFDFTIDHDGRIQVERDKESQQ